MKLNPPWQPTDLQNWLVPLVLLHFYFCFIFCTIVSSIFLCTSSVNPKGPCAKQICFECTYHGLRGHALQSLEGWLAQQHHWGQKLCNEGGQGVFEGCSWKRHKSVSIFFSAVTDRDNIILDWKYGIVLFFIFFFRVLLSLILIAFLIDFCIFISLHFGVWKELSLHAPPFNIILWYSSQT